MSIQVERQLKDGTKRKYEYDSINGVSVNSYMQQKMKARRQKTRDQLGLPQPKRSNQISPEQIQRINTLRQQNWRYSDIAVEMGVTEYIVRKLLKS